VGVAPVGRVTPTTDAFRMVIGLLMLITISRIHQHFHFLKPLRPAMSLVLLAGLYALMNPRFLSRDYAPKTWSWKIVTAMAVMACLSVPFGISMGNSGLFIIQEYSKTILFAFLVLLAIRHSGDLLSLLWAFAGSGAALAWLSLTVFKLSKGGGSIARIQNAYSYDSNDLGLVAVLCVAITVLLWQVSRSRGKMVCMVLLTGLGASIARTGSRGAFLALVVVGAALLVLVRGVSSGKKLAFVGVVTLGLLVAAPPGYWDQMRTILEPKQDYNWTSETGRKKVFERGVGYMLSRPLTGLGVGNFARAEGMVSDRAQAFELDPSMRGIKWSAAHNSFVEAGAEMGVPGLILFCFLVFGGIFQARKLRLRMRGWEFGDEEQRLLYFASLYLPVAFIGFAVGGGFVSFAYLDPIYVLVALVGGLQISYDAKLRRDRASRERPALVAEGCAQIVQHSRTRLVPIISALPPPERVPVPVMQPKREG
jgi:O-antigen ligase